MFRILMALMMFYAAHANSAVTVFNDGFESANIDAFRCSGNCPGITTKTPKTGQYSGDFILTPAMSKNHRTELVFRNGDGVFDKGKEYWISMDYRYKDWTTDSSPEIAPFQVHTAPSSFGSGCNLGAAVTTAPFLMVSQNNEVFFKTYNGNVLWRGPIQKNQWLNIKVHFRMSAGNDGFIEAWKDGVKLGRVNGATGPLLDNCGEPMKSDYFKIGIYKWDWKRGNIKESTRRQILIDNVKIVEGADGGALVGSPVAPQDPVEPEDPDPVVTVPDPSDPLITDPPGSYGSSGIISDGFNTAQPSTIWTFNDPVGDSVLSMSGTGLEITVHEGVSHDLWENAMFAPTITQPANNADFIIETKFKSSPSQQYQLQGIVIKQNDLNMIRTDFYHDGESINVFAATFVNGNASMKFNVPIASGSKYYLKLARVGNEFTVSYSYDRADWFLAGSFSHELTVSKVGIFAGNAPDITSSTSPEFKVQSDYFIVDGVFPQTTNDVVPPVINDVFTPLVEGGVIGRWKTGYPILISDLSGNGRDLKTTYGASITRTSGVVLNGDDGHIDSGTMSLPNNFTYSIWALSRDIRNCVNLDCVIVSKGFGEAITDKYFQINTIRFENENRLQFILKAGGSTTTLTSQSGNFNEGTWNLISVTYDGAEMKIYMNGDLVGLAAKTGDVAESNEARFWIGDQVPLVGSKPWSGYIGNIELRSYAMTPEEILSLYRR